MNRNWRFSQTDSLHTLTLNRAIEQSSEQYRILPKEIEDNRVIGFFIEHSRIQHFVYGFDQD